MAGAMPEDPTLEAELDRALAPYAELLPPEMLAHLREALGDALTTHPVGLSLLERVRPAKRLVASEAMEMEGTPEVKAPREKDGTGGAA
jgi:hypothetical protein